MPSSINIQMSINWALPLLEEQPLLINGTEPALTSANMVLQTMLGPPFAWPFNRSMLAFQTNAQDYNYVGLADFGFLEGGTVQAASGGKPFGLLVKNFLDFDQSATRPTHCAPLIDDGMGNITFRLSPSPDQAYNVVLPYQRKAVHLQSLAFTWAPIPDERVYICQWGFLALMSLIGNDARFGAYNSKFIASLLGNQGGLTEMERNIFLTNWARVTSQLQATQLETQERYRTRET